MDPRFTRKAPLLLAGLSAALPPRTAPPTERPRVIQELTRALMSRVAEITTRVGPERYSVIENDVLETGKTPILHALVAVTSHDGLPAWCERFTLPAGNYAAFSHTGHPRELGKTVAAIYRTWVPQIPGLFKKDLEVFVYPPGYDPTHPDATLAYWLPVD